MADGRTTTRRNGCSDRRGSHMSAVLQTVLIYMRGLARVRSRELSLSATSGLAFPTRGQSAFQRSTVVKLRPRPVRGQRLTHAWRGGQPEGSLYVYSGDAPCAAKRRIYSPHAEVRRQAYGKALCCSARVRRQGLEPRTRGLRVGRSGVPGVLPAQCPHADARKAHIAQ